MSDALMRLAAEIERGYSASPIAGLQHYARAALLETWRRQRPSAFAGDAADALAYLFEGVKAQEAIVLGVDLAARDGFSVIRVTDDGFQTYVRAEVETQQEPSGNPVGFLDRPLTEG